MSIFSVAGLAQDRQSLTLNFEQAVELALKNYPAISAAQAQARAAEAGVELARTNYLPRADMLWQQNRATRNNVFGLLLPQSVIPGISGPQLDSTSLSSAWGSAGGLMLSWEPFDFGLRKSNVGLARAIQAGGRERGSNTTRRERGGGGRLPDAARRRTDHRSGAGQRRTR